MGVVKRSGPIRRKTHLSPMSKKVASRAEERRAVVAAALSRDGGCVAARLVPSVRCVGPLDGHEVLPRGRGGDAYDLENVITVCRIHHGWIHNNPRESKEYGLLR